MSDPKSSKTGARSSRSAASKPAPEPSRPAQPAQPAARSGRDPEMESASSSPSPSQPPGAPKPDSTGEQGLHKPEHRHFPGSGAPSDYQIDPGDRYRRIAVREGSSAPRGSRKKAAENAPGHGSGKAAGDAAAAPGAAGAVEAAGAVGGATTPGATTPGATESAAPFGAEASGRPDSGTNLLDLTSSSLSSVPAVPNPPAPALHSPSSEHSRDHKPLRIAHLYPSLLNVAGDGGNLMALQRRAQWRGIPVDIVAVEKGDTPDFRTFDIVLFHGGQDVEMAVAAADFALKAPSLRAAVADGVIVFAVCAGLQLLGHRYVSNAGEEMLGAGILDLETHGGPQRFMQHAACEVEINGTKETVVGFENHSGLTALGSGCEAFGHVLAGAGNNGRDGLEGARSGNVFATYLHGPVLPKNPWLTDQLIRIAVGRAEGVAPARVSLATLDDSLEQRAHEVALAKAMANRGKRTALEPARLVRGQKAG